MRRLTGLLAATTMTLAACGAGGGRITLPSDPDAVVLQIHSEGGFAPIEQTLSWGPTYTLLADGRLIFPGAVIEIYPGPLLANTQIITITEEQMDEILGLIEQVGLPDMVDEHDDSAGSNVADATTEVFTFWDADRAPHIYSVYALGFQPDPIQATEAAIELVDALSTASFSGVSEEYVSDRVQVIAGVSGIVPDPGFEDIRPWPLEGEDPGEWAEIEPGFKCKVFGPETIELFRSATQLTQWLHPDPMMDAPAYFLAVRPLHPGEPGCS